MPEIKHNFTKGKMNKDLDERIIPNGEYRDAMNIQVTTSEGADVGVVQNILGNTDINFRHLGVDIDINNFKCVGSVSDEKTDSSYWFLMGPKLNAHDIESGFEGGIFSRDYILKLKNNILSIVFTDTKDILSKSDNWLSTTGGLGGAQTQMDALDPTNNIINIPFTVNLNGTLDTYWIDLISEGNILTTIIDANGTWHNINATVLAVHKPTNSADSSYIIVDNFSLAIPNNGAYDLIFKSNCLNFQSNNIITGINVLNDLLLWTDNHNEPKMLNIKRSIQGTDQDGQLHTNLINPELPTLHTWKKVEPHHIQVIKRKPAKKLNVLSVDDRRKGVIYGTTTFKFSGSTNILYNHGFEGTLTVASGTPGTNVNYQIGDVILLLNTIDLLAANNKSLPQQYDVKFVVKDIVHDNALGTSEIDFEIISIATTTPLNIEDYTSLLFQEKSDLFEEELFRFSYRYRYLDEEVSAFAPFTASIFISGGFKYDQTTAYNYGMLNNIIDITITDFFDFPNTLDVASVDLLMKNENSTSIYLIDTIKRGKFPQTSTDVDGNPFGGTYKFNPKQIKATLPENQLLRAWDNVPKKALAQDISGNRLIYGNYTESYGYDTENLNITPSVAARGVDLKQIADGAPSVKTQRSYQLGVVLVDAEGRESPIMTNETLGVIVPKSMANTNTMLSVSNNSSIPSWVNSYKYYVKDSLQPFYNIVIDSFYKAQNGDFWLAVPSSERNKLVEGDLIELKKGINSDAPVLEKLRSKVIAIENEAPDFVKTVYRSLGRAKTKWSITNANNVTTTYELIPPGGLPAVAKNWFWIAKGGSGGIGWLDQNDGGFGGGGDIVGYVDCAVQFSASGATAIGGEYKSRLYACSSITLGGHNYVIRLEDPINPADDWIIDPDPSTANPGIDLEPTLKVEVFEKTTTPSAEYHGKFFVKIEAKEDLLENIAAASITSGWEEIQLTQPILNFDDSQANGTTRTSVDGNAIDESIHDSSLYQHPIPTISPNYKTDNYGHWNALMEYDSVQVGNQYPQYWFIDRMFYLGVQIGTGNAGFGMNYADLRQDDNNNMGRGIFQGKIGVNDGAYGGNFIQDGSWYMELSLAGMFADITWNDTGSAGNNTHGWSAEWVGVSNGFGGVFNGPNHDPTVIYAPNNQMEILQRLRFPYQKWKWEGNDTIFTITNSTIQFRYNYLDPTEAEEEHYDDIDYQQGYTTNPATEWKRAQFDHPLNRRLTVIIEMEDDPRAFGIDPTDPTVCTTQDHVNMVFLEQSFDTEEGRALRTSNPAVFEVRKKDEEKLDLYYEASDEIPINLNYKNLQRLIPIGSKVSFPGDSNLLTNSTVWKISEGSPSRIFIDGNLGGATAHQIWQDIILKKEKIRFTTPSGDVISVEIQSASGTSTLSSVIITPVNSTLGNGFNYNSSWSNCVSFRNGVESFYLKDDYNEKHLTKGVKVSATLEKEYKETYKKSGLIYSGIFNSVSSVNNLNQFIQAEKITKDINPIYGSIQKLYGGWGQGGDLLTLCEDRVLKVLADKDALYNADGNVNITSTKNVLGQTIPYSGEYGISKNPESFASEAYRSYFTDKQRGAVMRLSMDGLTPISDHGMRDWFRDNLKLSDKLFGSFDDRNNEYNITLDTTTTIPTTVSFREDVKGWVSFKSFVPENAISCANEYYTFANSKLWKHYTEILDPTTGEDENRNTFYGDYTDSSIKVVLNESPESVKSFHTLDYEGSQSQVIPMLTYTAGAAGDEFLENQYYNLTAKDGWYVKSAVTDLETGSLNEFIEKEGKWFNYFHGESITSSGGYVKDNYDTGSFAVQGIGFANNIELGENPPSWDCVDFNCVDPGTGLGQYSSIAACQAAGCLPSCILSNANLNSASGPMFSATFSYQTPLWQTGDILEYWIESVTYGVTVLQSTPLAGSPLNVTSFTTPAFSVIAQVQSTIQINIKHIHANGVARTCETQLIAFAGQN